MHFSTSVLLLLSKILLYQSANCHSLGVVKSIRIQVNEKLFI